MPTKTKTKRVERVASPPIQPMAIKSSKIATPLSRKALLVSVTISEWTARKLDKKVTDEINRKHGAANDAGHDADGHTTSAVCPSESPDALAAAPFRRDGRRSPGARSATDWHDTAANSP